MWQLGTGLGVATDRCLQAHDARASWKLSGSTAQLKRHCGNWAQTLEPPPIGFFRPTAGFFSSTWSTASAGWKLRHSMGLHLEITNCLSQQKPHIAVHSSHEPSQSPTWSFLAGMAEAGVAEPVVIGWPTGIAEEAAGGELVNCRENRKQHSRHSLGSMPFSQFSAFLGHSHFSLSLSLSFSFSFSFSFYFSFSVSYSCLSLSLVLVLFLLLFLSEGGVGSLMTCPGHALTHGCCPGHHGPGPFRSEGGVGSLMTCPGRTLYHRGSWWAV